MEIIASTGDDTSSPDYYCLSFQQAVYPLEILKRSALKFSDNCVFDFQVIYEETEVKIGFRNPFSEEEKLALINDFKTEVLDQDLRLAISKETEPVRNLILANVFSKTSLVQSSDE